MHEHFQHEIILHLCDVISRIDSEYVLHCMLLRLVLPEQPIPYVDYELILIVCSIAINYIVITHYDHIDAIHHLLRKFIILPNLMRNLSLNCWEWFTSDVNVMGTREILTTYHEPKCCRSHIFDYCYIHFNYLELILLMVKWTPTNLSPGSAVLFPKNLHTCVAYCTWVTRPTFILLFVFLLELLITCGGASSSFEKYYFSGLLRSYKNSFIGVGCY